MRDPFKRLKLTKYERKIEGMIERDEFAEAKGPEVEKIKAALLEYKKNATLNMRINEAVLQRLKDKAKKIGVKYQTFIAEILRSASQS